MTARCTSARQARCCILALQPSQNRQPSLIWVLISKPTPGASGSAAGIVHQTPLYLMKKVREDTNELSCSHSITDYNMILWYKQDRGGAMELLGYLNQKFPAVEDHWKGKFSFSGDARQQSNLIINDLRINDSAVYFCAASTVGIAVYYTRPALFGPGTRLTVSEPDRDITLPTVTLLPPSPKECRSKDNEGLQKTLVCVAKGFFPDHVEMSWQVDGETVKTGVATDSPALPDGAFYKMTSRLQVAADVWFTPGRTFTCVVSLFDGTDVTRRSKTLYGIEGKRVRTAGYLKLAQSAKLSYAVLLVKGSVYAAFVGFLLWRRQVGTSKLRKTGKVCHFV
uniref:Ig-like domain-containing protein n=1 Tax=Hippocampus comes TaxID=109280 RepID=A0A3Q3DLG3_HIPCM